MAKAYDRALKILAANVQVLPRFPGPVLIEGANYAGIWQECGSQTKEVIDSHYGNTTVQQSSNL